MNSRVRNLATVEDLVKVFRCHGTLQARSFVGASCEKMCDDFEKLLEDLLYSSSRPSKSCLERAIEISAGEQLSKDEQQQLLERLLSTVSFCRDKSRSMVTGKKLPPSIRRLCQVIRKVSDPDFGSQVRMVDARTPLAITSHLKRLTAPPLPSLAKRRAIASTSSSCSAPSHEGELDRLRKLYGLPVEGKQALVQEVLSSQEELDQSSAAVSATQVPKFVQYSTPTGMVRLFDNGQKQEGVMAPGTSGFAVAKFGSEDVQTEVPNILLSLPLKASGQRARKKPAAAVIAAEAEKLQDDEGEEEENFESDIVVDPVVSLQNLYGKRALQAPKPKPFSFADGSTIFFCDGSQQCYISMSTPQNPKKHLLVSVTIKMSRSFRQVVLSIWEALVKGQSPSKEKALHFRSMFLK